MSRLLCERNFPSLAGSKCTFLLNVFTSSDGIKGVSNPTAFSVLKVVLGSSGQYQHSGLFLLYYNGASNDHLFKFMISQVPLQAKFKVVLRLLKSSSMISWLSSLHSLKHLLQVL